MNSIDFWLEPYSWDFITAQNQVLCDEKCAHHGPTSDGHLEAMQFWQEARMKK